MARLSVRIPDDLQAALERIARTRGISESEVVRDAVESYIQSQPRSESAYEVAKRTGLVGAAKNLPADLSTNPDHLKGFGK